MLRVEGIDEHGQTVIAVFPVSVLRCAVLCCTVVCGYVGASPCCTFDTQNRSTFLSKRG
jgi:hypothetical protein